jgi:predicted DNA-binding transcriptional regulator AlpA
MDAKNVLEYPARSSVSSESDSMIGAMTVTEFCALYGISRTSYQRLRAQGSAPRELRVGTSVRITRRAALEWEEKTLADGGASTRD